MAITQPCLLFLGDAVDRLAAKTAAGVGHWRRGGCLGQLRLPGCNADLGLPDMRGLPHQPLPDLQTCIDGHLTVARLTNPSARCIGVAVNTAGIRDDGERRRLLDGIADRMGLPAVDPVRDGVGAVADRLPRA